MNSNFSNSKIKKLFVFLLSSSVSCLAFGDKINAIQIRGLSRIEETTAESFLKINVGDQYSSSLEENAIKNLYATDLFSDIKVDFRDSILHVDVVENPFVSKVIFLGNSRMSKSILSEHVSTKAGQSLNKSNIEQDVLKIKEMYKRSGRFLVSVEAEIKDANKNKSIVIYKIKEGPKTSVKTIKFVGNESFSDSELKQVILTKETKWFRLFDSSDSYDPDRLEYDKQLLKDFYNSIGYADFRVLSANVELSKNKKSFDMLYSIEEGDLYKIDSVEIKSMISEIDSSSLAKLVNVKKGALYNSAILDALSEKMNSHLREIGYPDANVNHAISKDFNNKTVNVIFSIDKASKIYVDKVNVYGNSKTIRKVIGRQMKIAEGDIYKHSLVQKSERNIRNLDFFENVSIEPSQSDVLGKANIDVFVEEKSTASIGLEAGYSNIEGPFGKISLNERNFAGTGKAVDFGIQRSRKRLSYLIGITEPYFMDRDLYFGVNFSDVHNQKSKDITNFDSFESNTKTLRISLGYNFSNDLYHNVHYMIKRNKASSKDQKVRKNGKEIPSVIRSLEGDDSKVTSSIGHSFVYDKADNRYNPKNGYIFSVSQEFAGVGGSVKYLKHDSDIKLFKSFMKNNVTLKVSANVGHIMAIGKDNIVSTNDRFSLGDFSLRGFEFGGVGPRHKGTKEGLGGKKFYSVQTELNFPVGLPKEFNISGSVFMDIGGLWDFDISKTAKEKYKDTYGNKESYYDSTSPSISLGFGVSWITRFAPIRLDWGFPIKKQKYDQIQRFHIRMVTHF